MKLIVPILFNCILVLMVYLLDKYSRFNKMKYMARQAVIGILFGGVSIFASGFGVEFMGTVVNVRDAAPMSAGLLFGAPAGIISGVIGGLYRWFSVYWGAGMYTQLACSIATILAGIMAAGFRKYMFDNKKPTWGYGVCIAVICEVIHMLLIFLTNMKDSVKAFEFVKVASIPMIIGNALAVGLAVIIVSILSHEKFRRKKVDTRISQTFQRWLLVCIILAFLITSAFTFGLQNGMAKLETKDIFVSSIRDVVKDVKGKSDDYLLGKAYNVAEIYENDNSVSLEDVAAANGIIEINVVTENGDIIKSTEERLVNAFNMNDTEQSEKFMVLTRGEKSYVQEYGPEGSDGITMRKYAAVVLKDGGFIQVGYNSDQFHEAMDEFVIDVTKNRHVGSDGFIAVCDESLNLVTQTKRNGKHISNIGIIPNEEMKQGKTATKLYNATVVNSDTDFAEKYIYAFTFVEGYCIIAAMPETDVMFMRDASLYTSVFMQVLVFAMLFISIYVLIKKVIINNMKKINASLAEITEGNLDVIVDVRSNEEFASLSDDINSTVDTLKKYIAEAAARIDKELEYAKQIQLSALPINFPECADYNIYAQMIAAKEVGGDFYDFYKLSDDSIAFLVADVSGKGIPAAMFMMTAKTIIKDLAESGIAVNEIFTKANEKLCENNESGMFVTAWMGILDTKTGKLQYANAGHNPPLVMRGGKEFEFLKSRAGFVLAGMEGINYKVNEIDLKPGDRILLYTDGVTEATDSSEALFGDNRLLEYVNANKKSKAAEMLLGLKADIDKFVGEAPQFDDITMLMFDYKPIQNNVFEEEITKVFQADDSELYNVLGFVEEELEKHDCNMKNSNVICVAIEEVFVNIAHYAYGEKDGNVELAISFNNETREITFKMSDEGIPFNPLEKTDPDITLSAEEREIGGLGLFIVKKSMDAVNYAYENNKNILIMVKKI